MVVSAEGRAYKKAVLALAECDAFPKDVPVKLTMRWFRARRSGDLDNRLKLLGDSLRGVAYADDKQIVEIHAYRFEDKRNPRVEVTVEVAA